MTFSGGEPWPTEMVTKGYYTNSSGEVFYNGLSSASRTNGDSRLATAGVAGSYATVGGTGVVVPLLHPGSGQKQLNKSNVSGSHQILPKWTQYVTNTAQANTAFIPVAVNFGDGSSVSNLAKTYENGLDTHHTGQLASPHPL